MPTKEQLAQELLDNLNEWDNYAHQELDACRKLLSIDENEQAKAEYSAQEIKTLLFSLKRIQDKLYNLKKHPVQPIAADMAVHYLIHVLDYWDLAISKLPLNQKEYKYAFKCIHLTFADFYALSSHGEKNSNDNNNDRASQYIENAYRYIEIAYQLTLKIYLEQPELKDFIINWFIRFLTSVNYHSKNDNNFYLVKFTYFKDIYELTKRLDALRHTQRLAFLVIDAATRDKTFAGNMKQFIDKAIDFYNNPPEIETPEYQPDPDAISGAEKINIIYSDSESNTSSPPTPILRKFNSSVKKSISWEDIKAESHSQQQPHQSAAHKQSV